MSQWAYEQGRNACLQNMAHDNFSNHLGGISPKTPEERQYWREWAIGRLGQLGIPVEEWPDDSYVRWMYGEGAR